MHFCSFWCSCKYFINKWRHTFYLTKNGQEFTKYIRSFMTAIMLYLERWKRIFSCMAQYYGTEPVNFTITLERPGNQWSLAYHGIVLLKGESACSSSLRVQLTWYLITFLLYIEHYYLIIIIFLVTTINLRSVNSQKRPK